MKSLNRLSEAAKFLIIAGTILIVCTLVVVGFFVMKEGKEGTNKSLAQFNGLTSAYSDVEREKYHNLEISGSSLLELIEKEQITKEVSIEYSTKAGPTLTPAPSPHEVNRKNTYYINPSGSFKGKVVKDVNGVIIKILFTQVK